MKSLLIWELQLIREIEEKYIFIFVIILQIYFYFLLMYNYEIYICIIYNV